MGVMTWLISGSTPPALLRVTGMPGLTSHLGIGAELQFPEAYFLAQGHQFKDVFIIGIAVGADDHRRLHAAVTISLLLGSPPGVGEILLQIESLFAEGAKRPGLAD